MKKHLIESADLSAIEPSEEGTWKVRLISEGKGSSGVYTSELLENHHKAFNNVLSYRNHPSGGMKPSDRDFTMIAGKIVGETWVDKDDRGLTAVYGNFLPDPEYAEKLSRYKDQLGLSIFIEGSGYLNEDNEFVVDWFNPEDPYASVDVVIAAGARGRFEESMRDFYSANDRGDTPGARQVESKETYMDEELKESIRSILETLKTLVAEKEAREAANAQAEVDSQVVASAVEAYAAAEKAIAEANLTETQADLIRAAAKRGEDVAPLIESAKTLEDEIAKSLRESLDPVPMGRLSEDTVSRFGAFK